MKKTNTLKYKVYIEWFNYLNEVQGKDLVATFISEHWAKHFLESTIIDDRFSRFIIESEETR